MKAADFVRMQLRERAQVNHPILPLSDAEIAICDRLDMLDYRLQRLERRLGPEVVE